MSHNFSSNLHKFTKIIDISHCIVIIKQKQRFFFRSIFNSLKIFYACIYYWCVLVHVMTKTPASNFRLPGVVLATVGNRGVVEIWFIWAMVRLLRRCVSQQAERHELKSKILYMKHCMTTLPNMSTWLKLQVFDRPLQLIFLKRSKNFNLRIWDCH